MRRTPAPGDTCWRLLASAFLDLAHGDRSAFDALPASARATEAGELCEAYLRSGDRALLDEAGRLLTGSRDWYVYLGRAF
jgi:hypothetical protein